MLEAAKVHQSLIRDNLLWGCDRELILLAGLTGLGLAAVGQTKVSVTVGVSVFMTCFLLLKMVGRADAQMRNVYLRYLRYPARMDAGPHPLHAGSVEIR